MFYSYLRILSPRSASFPGPFPKPGKRPWERGCLPDVALASRAPITSSKYFSTLNRWKSWACDHGLTAFPASPFHLALYLRHLMSEAKTASPLESVIHSIAWMHQLGGEPSPTDHPSVKRLLSGAQRLLAHHTSKKEPITVSQLEQLVACKADAMASLYNIRSVVINLFDSFCCIS